MWEHRYVWACWLHYLTLTCSRKELTLVRCGTCNIFGLVDSIYPQFAVETNLPYEVWVLQHVWACWWLLPLTRSRKELNLARCGILHMFGWQHYLLPSLGGNEFNLERCRTLRLLVMLFSPNSVGRNRTLWGVGPSTCRAWWHSASGRTTHFDRSKCFFRLFWC